MYQVCVLINASKLFLPLAEGSVNCIMPTVPSIAPWKRDAKRLSMMAFLVGARILFLSVVSIVLNSWFESGAVNSVFLRL